jgi:CelD/BcsL family acetyltransferase involved in cellulose biosynthesis
VLLEPIALLSDSEADWRTLAAETQNPFTSWEWASTWWRHFGSGRELRAFRCRDEDGRLAGIVPLQVASSHGLRVLRFIGHRPADELAPLCRSEDRAAVAQAFGAAVREARGWDVCLAERLPPEQSWAESLGGRVLRREPSPEVALETRDWDGFLAARSSNFRQQVRKFERRLLRDHGLRYRLVTDPATLEEDMRTLFHLHRARWGKVTTAFPEELVPFHMDLADAALRAGWLRLWFAELDGRPAAAWYGFRMGGADWFYQQGRDPAWERESLGFVLTAHTIREAVTDGMSRYRFLLGGEEYKARFATSEPSVETVTLAATARGTAALAGARAVRRLPARLRQPLGRLAEKRA